MARSLTKMQAEFVRSVARGANRTMAARIAGYAAPAQDASRLIALPHVRDALRKQREAAIHGDLSTIAIDTMRELMTDAPAAQRYQAARWVLEQSGHRDNSDTGDADRPLDELGPEDLARAVQSGLDSLKQLAGSLDGVQIVDGQARHLRTIEGETVRDDEDGEPGDQATGSALDFMG